MIRKFAAGSIYLAVVELNWHVNPVPQVKVVTILI